MNFQYFTFFLLSVFLISACSTGHCRRDRSGGQGPILEKLNPKPPTNYEQRNLGEVTVAKADGSLQCEPNSGLDLERMAEDQLAGIEILSSSKQNDGLIRIQVCGTETGMLNTYRIQSKDVPKVLKAGFTLFKIKSGGQ